MKSKMIQTFSYRTKIEGKEFLHTIHSQDLTSSILKWVVQIEDLKEQVYSFKETVVEQIKVEFKEQRIELNTDEKLSYLRYTIKGKSQITYIDSVKKGRPHFIAELRFLTTEEGGRKGYAASGYRPHFQLEGKKELTSAELLFVDKDKVFPGELVLAEIRIIGTEVFEGLLYQGLEFKLGEGNRIVAEGVINEVINQNLKKK